MSDLWRQRVSQDLWVCVEDSHNIVLEALSADGSQVLSRKLVTDVGRLTEKLGLARVYVRAAEDDAHARRSLPRPGEQPGSRREARARLTDAGASARAAELVMRRAYGHLSGTIELPGDEYHLATVTYDRDTGQYAIDGLVAEEDTCC